MSDPFGPTPPASPPWQTPPSGTPDPWQLGTRPDATPEAPGPDAPGRRGLLLAGLAASALVLFAVIGWIVWTALAPADGPSYPDQWDPRVASLAAFVEEERGAPFDRPVYVDFLPEEEFRAEVITDEADLTDEDRAEIAQAEAQLRALGLVEGDIDLFAEQNAIAGEGTLAFYDPDTKRVTVRGTEITTPIEVTLVHELVHAWQDQQVDLSAVEDGLDDDAFVRYRSVVEGDAVNVMNAYVDAELTPAEQREYRASEDGGGEPGSPGEDVYAGIPTALVAFQLAPYALGPWFVAVVEEIEGNAGVDRLLREPPASEAQLFDPTQYLARTEPVGVETPGLPEGATEIDDGSFGALAWYLVLASRLDAGESLEAVDGWAGDSYRTYELPGGRVCVEARFVASAPDAADLAQTALDQWSAFMPTGASSIERVDATRVDLRSCDPGEDAAAVPNDLIQAVSLPAVRLALMGELLRVVGGAGGPDDVWCAADGVVDRLSIDQLQGDEPDPAVQREVVEVMASCGLTP